MGSVINYYYEYKKCETSNQISVVLYLLGWDVIGGDWDVCNGSLFKLSVG